MSYCFDSFVFDRKRGLFDAGKPVPLEPQVLNLLSYLLEHRNRVVGRDELIEEIWDGRIVSDAALSTQIRAARRALGDDRTQQKYIRTYPKRGFQFVAEVRATDAPDAQISAGQRDRRRGRSLLTRAAAAFAVLLICAAGLWWLGHNSTEGRAGARNLSIVVLPFDNLSGDPRQDYFADAVTEDLITDLSRIRDAFVIARRTSFTYKGKSTDVTEVAAELDVRYVLEGSVQRAEDRVRINAQLIDGQSGAHVWSDRYDRVLTDVFDVQNDITGQIASALKAELREADSRRQIPPANLQAWDYSLRGNVLLFNPTGLEDFQKAKALLDKSVALDPGIASAWSGLAFVHFVASLRPIPGITVANSKNLSLEAAEKAVALDPKNAEGHWMVGVGYARNGQPERGFASCETAMDINPNNDCAYVCAGLTKMALGEPAEALPHFRQSLRLNPRFRPFTKYKYMGLAHLHAGHNTEAIEVLNRAVAGAPKDPMANFALTSALALDGRLDEARESLKTSLDLAYSERTTLASLRDSYAWMGPGFERVLEGLRLAGMPEA